MTVRLLSYPNTLSKITLSDRSFTYAAPKLWTALSLDIRSESTVAGFEAKLKTYLFREVFSWSTTLSYYLHGYWDFNSLL